MTEKAKGNKCIIAIRVRGVISARREDRETLRMLNLTRNNYAVLIDDRSSFLGMLRAAQGYVTWGEASKETIATLIMKRGRLAGNKRLTEECLQKVGCKSIEELAQSVFNCTIEYWALLNIQPVFRLKPPTKGFKGNIKKGVGQGGELGYRGDRINELAERMI